MALAFPAVSTGEATALLKYKTVASSHSFSGSFMALYCQGGALQCTISKVAHKRACQSKDAPPSLLDAPIQPSQHYQHILVVISRKAGPWAGLALGVLFTRAPPAECAHSRVTLNQLPHALFILLYVPGKLKDTSPRPLSKYRSACCVHLPSRYLLSAFLPFFPSLDSNGNEEQQRTPSNQFNARMLSANQCVLCAGMYRAVRQREDPAYGPCCFNGPSLSLSLSLSRSLSFTTSLSIGLLRKNLTSDPQM